MRDKGLIKVWCLLRIFEDQVSHIQNHTESTAGLLVRVSNLIHPHLCFKNYVCSDNNLLHRPLKLSFLKWSREILPASLGTQGQSRAERGALGDVQCQGHLPCPGRQSATLPQSHLNHWGAEPLLGVPGAHTSLCLPGQPLPAAGLLQAITFLCR